MIDALKEIGEHISKKDNKSEIEIFLDKAKLSKTKKILCILLQKTEDGKYFYKKVISEPYSVDKPILYRGGSGRGKDILPSSLITEKVNKTFENKIIKWFNDQKESEVKEIREILENNKGKIIEALIKEYENFHKDERKNVLLTIKIEENGKEKHLGEIEIFRKILVEDASKKYYFLKSIGESKGKGICFLCKEHKDLYGFVLPAFGFSFATSDKPGFTPSFVQTDHWKYIPICKDCAKFLEIGKRFLDLYLNFPKKEENNFFGCNYYVLPKFMYGELFDEFYKYIEFFKDKEYEEGLLSKEDWLEKTLEEKKDDLRLIFIFYSKKGGGKYIDIVQYVEDVLPSWIKKIDRIQENIRKKDIFQEENIKKILGKDWHGDFVKGRTKKDKGLGINNWFIVFTRNFFPFSRTHGIYEKYFREITRSILSNRRINKDFLISAFVREIRNAIKDNDFYNMKVLCLKSFMLYLFFRELKLLIDENIEERLEKEVIKMGEEKFEERIENFFKEYQFDTPSKAAFSVGMLVGYLLGVQRKERKTKFGEEPFWDKLHGLMMDERRIKNIFTEAINKLRQYKVGFEELEEIAAKFLVKAGNKWNIPKDEISYYFALGITLNEMFIFESKK
ncbi:MAG: TIGR02556 family CRISPR-associated protein [Caldisericia bacterium]|jgi:CRISPR-associated protein Csh1|nr:TIGR02556 family CRISPR-associated protein [Caldisericia bacterium]